MGSPDQAKHGTRHAGNKFLPPAHNMKAMYCAALFLAMAFVGDAALPAMRPSTELIDLIGKLEEAAEAGAAAGEQISNALSQLGAMADSAGTAAGSGVVVGTFAIDYAEDTLISSEATIVSSLNTIRHRCPDVQQRVDHTLALVDSLRTMLHDLKVETTTSSRDPTSRGWKPRRWKSQASRMLSTGCVGILMSVAKWKLLVMQSMMSGKCSSWHLRTSVTSPTNIQIEKKGTGNFFS